MKERRPELRVEAVTQLQQAAEKATKGLMIANGMSHEDVESLQHNTSGAFLELIVHIVTQHQENLDWNALELAGGPRAGSDLIKLVFPRQKRNNRKVKLQRIWDSLFDDIDQSNKGTNTDWRFWRRETSTWNEQAINWILDGHQEYRDMWDRYIDRMNKTRPNRRVDPRPLLMGEVDPDVWVFDRKHAGLSEWFIEGKRKVHVRSSHSHAVKVFADYMIKSTMEFVGPHPLPVSVALTPVLYHIRDYTSAMLFLYVVGIITAPHASSSRYPAFQSRDASAGQQELKMGSQDYDDKLGVVKCIKRLSNETTRCIGRLEKSEDHRTWLVFK